ncbi:hypothetical protein EVA_13814 [gut metagenome]|uniref:Uncharacterized protein n=1 Tax=gut metagenome TaxID=749906 RepID=J9FT19_9ZZZZ
MLIISKLPQRHTHITLLEVPILMPLETAIKRIYTAMSNTPIQLIKVKRFQA